jgi:hypothetical protein
MSTKLFPCNTDYQKSDTSHVYGETISLSANLILNSYSLINPLVGLMID